MNEEEKKAIDKLKQTIDFNSTLYIDDLGDNDIKNILNIIDKQQKEIEEKSTIIMAGAEKVKQLEKEIEKLKKHTNILYDIIEKLKE